MKKTLTILLIIATLTISSFVLVACGEPVTTPTPTPTPTEPVFDLASNVELYDEIISTQDTYLKSLQLSSGAICKWSAGSSSQLVCPYFSCYAALALLEKPENAALVKNYCDWHFSALNKTQDANGGIYTIYDYNVDGETLTSTNNYDSSDSYAALFLMVLEKYMTVSGDKDYIISHSEDIEGVYGAMLSTRGSSGNSANLTAAKPNYEVYYLMDNSEVYAGCKAAVTLFDALNNDTLQNAAVAAADEEASGIEGLYYSLYKAFRPNSTKITIDKTLFYADMACQVYPVAFGAIAADSEYGANAYETFKKNFGTIDGLYSGADFPWIIIAYGAYYYDDFEFATEILENANEQYISNGNSYHWYCMEGAMAYLTASKLKAEI